MKTAEDIYQRDSDFIGEIYFLSIEEGGLSAPVESGFRPLFKLKGGKELTSSDQQFIGKNKALPGETITSEVRIIWKDPFIGNLTEGTEFELREGATLIGIGTITQVLNAKLQIQGN